MAKEMQGIRNELKQYVQYEYLSATTEARSLRSHNLALYDLALT